MSVDNEMSWWGQSASLFWKQKQKLHDDVMAWKRFLHYWPFVRGIHWWPTDSSSQSVNNADLAVLFVVSLKVVLNRYLIFELLVIGDAIRLMWRHWNDNRDVHVSHHVFGFVAAYIIGLTVMIYCLFHLLTHSCWASFSYPVAHVHVYKGSVGLAGVLSTHVWGGGHK